MRLNRRVKKPSHIIYRVVEGDIIILNIKKNIYYVLEKVGAKIWHWLIEDGLSIEDAIKKIPENYQVTKRDNIKGDIMELVSDLAKEGLFDKA